MLSLWLVLKVFASGCTAMTGVEAVSNGVNAFREPVQRNAKRTLTIIIVLLMLFLSGIALLCRAYNIGATDPSRRRLSEHPLAAHHRRHRPRLVLLRRHRLHTLGARAVSQYLVRRFSPSHPRHC